VRPLGPSLGVPQQPISVVILGTATHPLVLDQSALDQEDFDKEPLPVVPEQPKVDLDQYSWLFITSKGDSKGDIDAGLAQYQRAAEAYRHGCELQDVRLITCVSYLSNLARYLGVQPNDLAKRVQTLKSQNKEVLKVVTEGQRSPAKQERLKELEVRNQELEKALTSMGEVLQQHTSRWAAARVILNKLKELASPSIYVAGQAFLKGLQGQDAPTMVNVLLHIINTLAEEIGLKITDIRSLVGEVKSSFSIVVPAYRWDKEQKTFKQIFGKEGQQPGVVCQWYRGTY
jgi:hypothetical protein